MTQTAAAAPRRSLVQRAVRVLRRPGLVYGAINAQFHLRRRARVPLTVCLKGKAVARGGGAIRLGKRVVIVGDITPVELVSWPGGRIDVGDGVFLNYGVSISAHERVSIGQDCHIGHYAFIYDNDYHSVEDKHQLPPSRPVVLEDRVWLGTRVTVLKGVRIGHDAVVAAGSVVTHDIPPCSVAAGTPARVIRTFEVSQEREHRVIDIAR